MIYLDTHVAVYLGSGTPRKLSKEAQRLIDKSDLLISPMVVVELHYLYELGRTGYTAVKALEILEGEFRVKVCDLPFAIVAHSSIGETWTRDVFDRLIVAQARARDESILLTADSKILEHYPKAVW